MWTGFRRTSGRSRVVAALLATPVLSGCLYGFNAGTGLELETIAILPFENETTRLELTQELHDLLLRNLPGALGLRLAGEDVADAIVTGTIRDYGLRAPNYRGGGDPGQAPEVLQREVNVVVAVQILDVERNLILWDDPSLRTEGQYLEGSEDEETAKLQALDLMVQRIVDGLQSNW